MFEKVTIDLDFCTREKRDQIVSKILSMPCCDSVCQRDSFSKGYHLIVFCKHGNCQLCRLVFDDCNRFSMDSKRACEEQNVLWEKARMLKGHLWHTLP